MTIPEIARAYRARLSVYRSLRALGLPSSTAWYFANLA